MSLLCKPLLMRSASKLKFNMMKTNKPLMPVGPIGKLVSATHTKEDSHVSMGLRNAGKFKIVDNYKLWKT